MLSALQSISALLFSYAVLQLGHGLHTTLLGVRASMEGFPSWIIGLMMSFYFVGFIVGTHVCAKLIKDVKQIRTFAAFTSMASVISLFHALFVDPWAWVFFRFVYGVCIASLIMVIESWLNALSTKKNRGRIFAVYLTVSFLCLALGQAFIFSAQPSESVLFIVVSILISFGVVPITVSKTKQPDDEISTENFSLKRLWQVSPLATTGVFCTGLSLGAVWGLFAVAFTVAGFSSNDVAILTALLFVGGFSFQWPIGYISDVFDRRIAIVFVLASCLVTCFLMVFLIPDDAVITYSLMFMVIIFGGLINTLYSLFIALANDFLVPELLVKASGGLIVVHAVGAIIGPLIGSVYVQIFGGAGLFMYIVCVQVPLLLFALYRQKIGREIPKATTDSFVPVPSTNSAAFVVELDPRQGGDVLAKKPL